MAKVGDKYIIEIDSKMTRQNHKGFLYGIKGFDSMVMTDYGLEKLTKVTKWHDGCESAIQRAYRDGSDKTAHRYEALIKRLTDENCNLRCQVHAIEQDLEEMQTKYEDSYEEVLRMKDGIRKWVNDMKGRINDKSK